MGTGQCRVVGGPSEPFYDGGLGGQAASMPIRPAPPASNRPLSTALHIIHVLSPEGCFLATKRLATSPLIAYELAQPHKAHRTDNIYEAIIVMGAFDGPLFFC